MMGLGIIVMYLGYVVIFWSLKAFQGESQDSFASYIIPFAPKNPGVSSIPAAGGGGSSQQTSRSDQTTPAPTPADQKAAVKPNYQAAKNNAQG